MTDQVQYECQFVAELQPPPLKPLGVFIVATFYTGPGAKQEGGHWVIHTERFATRSGAVDWCDKLNNYHQQRRVYHLL